MTYAPIIIPTMCRYQHLVRLIESLKVNTWAKYTDVYIGLDYPSSLKYKEGYGQICKYLDQDFSEFRSFTVIKHKENLGSFANMMFLRNIVFEKYDRFIRTDDDAEFSPNFIEYMDKCLMEYEADPDVIAVSGYSYPISWKVSEGANALKENFICPMWGTGFWKDKFYKIHKDIKDGCLKNAVNKVFKDGLYKKMLNASKIEYMDLCTPYIEGENLSTFVTDISMRMYSVINNKYVVVPIISKVRNWGFDGSGEYCSKSDNYSFDLQKIDTSPGFDLKIDTYFSIDENRRLLDKFENVPLMKIFKFYLKILLYKILGKYAFYYRFFLNNYARKKI
jgi:hypothetical protein